VGSVGVVVDAVVLGQGLGLQQRCEGLDVEQIIAQLAGKGLDVRVL
jgi:hypothetical protein